MDHQVSFNSSYKQLCTSYRKLSSVHLSNIVETITFMSYNMLSDILIERRMYSEGDKYMDMNFRMDMMFNNDIDALNPDVLCIQEKQDTDNISIKRLLDRKYLVR